MAPSRSLPALMAVGFGLLCLVNVACFFPHALMPDAPHSVFRAYNTAMGIASTLGAVGYALRALRSPASFPMRSAVAGYVLIGGGIAACSVADRAPSDALGLLAGILCGMGLVPAMLYWFGMLAFLPERRAAVVQGIQALAGEVMFVGAFVLLDLPMMPLALVGLSASAILAMRVWGVTAAGARQDDALGLDAPLGIRASMRKQAELLRAGPFSIRDFLFPVCGFVLSSALYGSYEAVAMSAQGSSFGFAASLAGAPAGALAFLLWQRMSRTRSYRAAAKGLLVALAVTVGVGPFDGAVFAASFAFQGSGLLLYSLIVDELASRQRLVFASVAGAYGLSHAAYYLGLFIPRFFSVGSYGSFLDSKHLVLFFTYLVFGSLLALEWGRSRDGGSVSSADDPMEEESAIALPQVDGFQRACERVSAECGLTKRESEVLMLLARGRDAGYICEELCLARNTVKSYGKSIYAKLGVHRKQELIDLIEVAQEKDGAATGIR